MWKGKPSEEFLRDLSKAQSEYRVDTFEFLIVMTVCYLNEISFNPR